MNTLLLTTNTTNCTTKNLKKMAAVICMTAVFVFTNTAIFAQGFSNSQGKAENSSATTEEQRATKEAWVKEHQEELSKTVNPAVIKPAPVQVKAVEATVKTVETKTTVQPVEVKKGETPKVATVRTVNPGAEKSISNKQGQSIKSTEVKSAQVTEVKTVVAKKEVKTSDPTKLPYYNYKGVSNLEEAKKLWAAENQDAYTKMQTNTGVSQQNYPAVKPATNNGVSPNAHRRLPANYDDSKTNSLTK